MNITKIGPEFVDKYEKFGAKLPLPLTGAYDDFSVSWYYDIGAVISGQLVV